MYCTLADLGLREDVLVTLTDDEGLGVVNADRVNAAIAAATDEINAYAQARYSVPFDPVPGVIRKICADIAVYNLFCRRGYDEDTADKAVVDRYRAAVRFLENLARGLVQIGANAPAPARAAAEIESRPRIFTRDKMEGL